MENEKGKIGIGTKEFISLNPAKVKIIGFEIAMQKDKTSGKDVGEKVAIICKHPDKEENIKISSISYKKGKEIKTSGLWFKLDEDKLIPKGSALATLLTFLNSPDLDGLAGKEIMTELDEKKYLCFKAY